MPSPANLLRSRLLVYGAIVAVFASALVLTSGGFAMGVPSPWVNAQTGLSFPLYQPSTTLGVARVAFKLQSCSPGQTDWVGVSYGRAYAAPTNFGKVKGFSLAEGSPQICANPGIAKQVATKSVNGVKIRVSVYCDPTQFKQCTLASGKHNGYVLQWTQPPSALATPNKPTQMFMDSSRLSLPDVLKIAGGLRPVQ